MKKTILYTVIILLCLVLIGCEKKEKTFSLSEEYYQNSEFKELDKNTLQDLVNDKKSFAIFIYQPLCATSDKFNNVLTDFANQYQISFYKMSFSDMKQTELKEKIKYYPSLVIYQEGKVVDYLDANNDEHSDCYKNTEDFEKWFSSYVSIEKADSNKTSDDDNQGNDIKFDVELDNVVYNKEKVNIYFFWGDGCPHCEEEFEFFESIEKEYGNLYTLNTFEVWHNEENVKILEQFAKAMGDEITGVPYTIIGEKTFSGYSKRYEDDFLNAIKEQHKDSYDIYFKAKEK